MYMYIQLHKLTYYCCNIYRRNNRILVKLYSPLPVSNIDKVLILYEQLHSVP